MTDLRDLLKRIRQWDALDIPNSDGAYWKREIDAALEQPEPGPRNGARDRFEKWFASENFVGLDIVEIASLGFDAGHAFWHQKEQPEPEQKPVAYLYHDASTPRDAHPWLHSTMLVLAADRRPGLRGETPLFINQLRCEPLTVTELQQALIAVDLVDQDAIDDPEGYDGGWHLGQIDALHKRLTEGQT
jgi:hypothetical protein